MSEKAPRAGMEAKAHPESVSVVDEKVLSRLTRIGGALSVDLIDAFGEHIGLFVDKEHSTLSWNDFEHITQLLGLRAESLVVWEEEYFEEQFEETVRIARERGSHDH